MILGKNISNRKKDRYLRAATPQQDYHEARANFRHRLIRCLNIGNVSLLVFAVFAYVMLAMRNGSMLRWYDEMSLFEPTGNFFREFINYPGGVLRYAGAWLTQFMYEPELGSVILIALWLLMTWLICRCFRLSKAEIPLSLIVALSMLVSIVQLDEAWLTLKTPGYIYSNTLGYICTLSLILIFKASYPARALSLAWPTIFTLTYFALGFYGLLASALCVIILASEAIRERDYKKLLAAGLAVAMTFATPELYHRYWHGNLADNDFLLLKGLPELLMESFDIYLWLPFAVATIWLILLGLRSAITKPEGNGIAPWAGAALMLLSMAWVVKADHKSEQFRASVLMMRLMEQHNWQGINSMMTRLREEPNYTMLFINNLASASRGMEMTRLPEFNPRPADGRHNEDFTMSVFAKVPVYYYMGETNQSYRWCMEHTVQYGKRVFFLKYMVKNAIVDGEIELARKYNDILLRTMFHRKWAERMERFIENPSLIDKDDEFKAIRQLQK